MRIRLNKSSVEKQETRQDEKPCEPVRFTKGMAKNLTTLDIIALGLLITLQPVWFRGMLIELDSRKEKDENR